VAGVARVYDVVMTHNLDADEFFIHCVQRRCAERSLSFFLIEPVWVEAFHEALRADRVWARVLLNLHSEHHLPEDRFHRLVRMAGERGVQVVDPLEVALPAFDKARLHPRLVEAGFEVPDTLIVSREEARDGQLDAARLALLGSPFVIKPAMGYGRRGVILDAVGAEDLERSVAAWPDAHYLLQRLESVAELDGQPAYFRVFHVFGSIWSCWWNCHTDGYRRVTDEEERTHGLAVLGDLVRRVAALTGMRFFSSEIAMSAPGRFVLIDYVNDQCHMLSQGANPRMGVPNTVVAEIAGRLVDAAEGLINRQ
jgi:hypothetical protein